MSRVEEQQRQELGRFGHLAKDCWQNKSKSKGKDSKGKGGKKGKGNGKGKTNKDVCADNLAIGPRTVLTLRKPLTDLTDRTMQTTACGRGTISKSGIHRRNSTAERQHVAPTQPMSEPEAPRAESEQNCETNFAAELMSLEGRTAERITFGVDSGAALVIGKELGQKDLALRGPTGGSFAGVTGVSSQEFAVGEFFVEDWARSCFQQLQELHLASEDRCAAANGGEKWSLRCRVRRSG